MTTAAPAPPDLLVDGPEPATTIFLLAHGAGGGMDTPFMAAIAAGLAAAGSRVVRFEFPYMRRRRVAGKGGAPDREAVLLDAWRAVISQHHASPRLVIGGKSMGGRMATLIADEAAVAACICLGYPFHPPGRPDKLRTAHLEQLKTPTLILQGTRDPFGNRDDVAGYRLSEQVRVHWLEDGDHSLVPRKMSGRSHEQNLAEAVAVAAEFLARL